MIVTYWMLGQDQCVSDVWLVQNQIDGKQHGHMQCLDIKTCVCVSTVCRCTWLCIHALSDFEIDKSITSPLGFGVYTTRNTH